MISRLDGDGECNMEADVCGEMVFTEISSLWGAN